MKRIAWLAWTVTVAIVGWLAVSQARAGMVYCAERVDVAQCDAWMEAGR